MITHVKRVTIQLKNMIMMKFFMKDFCLKLNKEK